MIKTQSNVSIGYSTNNYDNLLKEARTRGIIKGELTILGENMQCFFVNDPNGVGIQVIREQ